MDYTNLAEAFRDRSKDIENYIDALPETRESFYVIVILKAIVLVAWAVVQVALAIRQLPQDR